MTNSELSEKNFKRISFLNWAMSLPLIILFAWPYLYICGFLSVKETVAYLGSIIFSIPFMTTILHGNVTTALGSAHRHHYYNWLCEKPVTFGLFFSPLFMKTRFRLVMVLISLVLLAIEYFIGFG